MRKIVYLFTIFLAINCKSQVKKEKTIEKKDSMEYLDTKDYESLMKNPVFASYGYYISSEGDKVQVYRGTNNIGFIKRIEKKDSPYAIFKVFHENGKLQLEGLSFYDNNYGIQKEYDELGNLIKETNYDLPYKYTIEDLATKMN
ncbi:hypothetical protein BWK58_15000, partial [Flavobacterium columnare]